MAYLSILQKPKDSVVFVDTSALLAILDVRSKSKKKRDVGEAYRKLFREFLPSWEIIGVINPLVLYEMMNAIQSMTLKECSGVPYDDVREIKREMTKRPEYYRPHWEKAHLKATQWFELIVDILKQAENILCHEFPGDDVDYSMSRDVLQMLSNIPPDGPNPADIFHYQFMQQQNMKTVIAHDKHFGMIKGIVLHTFM